MITTELNPAAANESMARKCAVLRSEGCWVKTFEGGPHINRSHIVCERPPPSIISTLSGQHNTHTTMLTVVMAHSLLATVKARPFSFPSWSINEYVIFQLPSLFYSIVWLSVKLPECSPTERLRPLFSFHPVLLLGGVNDARPSSVEMCCSPV